MEKIKRVLNKAVPGSDGDEDNKFVLITGGTGFVAAWVIYAFLSNGYRVRTTVRSNSKASDVKSTHSKYASNLEFAIVDDITKPGAFDEAVRGVHGVIHTASPFVLDVEDNTRDLLDPAVKGTTSILESITNYAPQVKRVVITSSFAAILDLDKGLRPGHSYTEADWNPVTWETAASGPGPVAYSASKTFAEKAAHDFVRDRKPNFTVAAINPPMIYGPLAQKSDIEHLNTSAADIWRLLDGSLAGQPPPPPAFPAFADVRNVAQAHFRAYEHDSGKDERYFVTTGNFDYTQVCEILRKEFPGRASQVPDPEKQQKEGGDAGGEYYKVDNTKTGEELQVPWISLEKCIADTGKSLLEVEKASKKGVRYDGQEWFNHF